jgi:hypothetical protein
LTTLPFFEFELLLRPKVDDRFLLSLIFRISPAPKNIFVKNIFL